MTPGGLIETAVFDTADGLYDCAWSEENENIVLAACADGSVKVYDLAAPPQANPLRVFQEHRNEVRDRADGGPDSQGACFAGCLPKSFGEGGLGLCREPKLPSHRS
jgi:hypothetical protein